MIRFFLIVLIVAGFLILFLPVLGAEWIIGHLNPGLKSKSSLKLVQATFRLIWKTAGTRLTVKGLDNIPDDQPVLYVANHQSYFDIVIGYTLVKGECGFISKKEMAKFPILSIWMQFIHCLFLDRSDPRKGLKTILAAIAKIKQGISIWIFPEGTRNQTKDELMPFKEGSLKIAEKTGCLIIPVAISHTADLFEKHVPRVTPADVTFRFGTPIDPKLLDKEEKKTLGYQIQEIIRQMLHEEEALRK